MEELKPCPFDGEQVEIVPEGDYLEICCADCGATMQDTDYERLARNWNRRV